MIVNVIVDVPTAQVDRPFDYFVPEADEAIIEIGIRVQVPFRNRQVMAIVIGISTETDFQGKLKPITKVMDYMSFLNEELVNLSEELAKKIFSFRISILQAMLPSMLRVKYHNYFIIHQIELFHSYTADYLPKSDQSEYLTETLRDKIPAKLLKQLINEEIISVDYRVSDQVTVKKIKYLTLEQVDEFYINELDQLKQNSKKQEELLKDIINNPQRFTNVLQTDFLNKYNYSRHILNIAIEKNWLKVVEKEVYRNPLAEQDVELTSPKQLLADQAKAFSAINQARKNKEATTFLLEGVTGSGKTEVYLQLIQEARDNQQSALFLVPEISLTPQMVNRVKGRFQTGIAVLHSGLSTSERYDEWRRIIHGEATIVVGARSSIFAPIKNIGIIIIDEEHETTYKQADNPRYHARDVAIWRSEYHGCPVVLGSATPSLESRSRAEVGRYQLLKMPERVNKSTLPKIELVDMTQIMVRETTEIFSPLLQEKIANRLAQKEQIILLLNRRGYASYLLCRECGEVLQCPRCDISLTYHKSDQSMKCHYCDYHCRVPNNCPNCQSPNIRTFGLGTQKVAESIEKLFPEAVTVRMDVDTTRRKGQHEKILKQFSDGKADILLGTQMIAKGLDFEKVTLVGVINADTALNLPDFRSSERTFQLMTQVAGRAGRGRYEGEVVVQTFNPDHYVMQLVKLQNYDRFFYTEMQRRHLALYPPYFYMTSVTVSSKSQAKAQQKIYELKSQIYQPQMKDQLILLGPSKGSIARINEHYYFQILLKYKDQKYVQEQLTEILSNTQKDVAQGVYVNIDHEPQYFM